MSAGLWHSRAAFAALWSRNASLTDCSNAFRKTVESLQLPSLQHTQQGAPKRRPDAAIQAEPAYPELSKAIEQADSRSGSENTVQVLFREVDNFSLWLWFEMYTAPSGDDKDLLETLLESWFVVGRMGGFNSMNFQVSNEAVGETSFYRYESEETESAAQATFLDYGALESRGKWCRFWVNMGTADEVALDVLINALSVFSRENVGIKQLIVGGINTDWPVPNKDDQIFPGSGAMS